jgi:hypothetical protein
MFAMCDGSRCRWKQSLIVSGPQAIDHHVPLGGSISASGGAKGDRSRPWAARSNGADVRRSVLPRETKPAVSSVTCASALLRTTFSARSRAATGRLGDGPNVSMMRAVTPSVIGGTSGPQLLAPAQLRLAADTAEGPLPREVRARPVRRAVWGTGPGAIPAPPKPTQPTPGRWIVGASGCALADPTCRPSLRRTRCAGGLRRRWPSTRQLCLESGGALRSRRGPRLGSSRFSWSRLPSATGRPGAGQRRGGAREPCGCSAGRGSWTSTPWWP